MSNKKPSIRAVAERAGVSVATVDRVLSDRAKVSDKTALKVLNALRELGSASVLPSGARHIFRFEVVMSLSDETFFARYEQAFQHCATKYGVQVRLRRFHSLEGNAAILEAIQAQAGRYHGLALIVEDNASLRGHCQALKQAGKATVFISSEVGEQGGHYVGVDNLAAGRTAAYLLGGFMGGRGRVLLGTHHLAFRSHAQRVQGFMQVCRARFPALEVLGPVHCDDTDAHGEARVRAFVEQAGQVEGVYHTGAGNAGVAAALAGHPLRAWVAHEVTPANRALLMAGKVAALIDQNAELQAAACVQALLYQLGAIGEPPSGTVPFSIVTPENL